MTDQPSYTRVPNDIIENMPQLGNAELRVLLAIARKTVGFQKECDRISVSQIADMTGLTSRNAQHAITTLLEKNLIEREPANKQSYCYNLKPYPLGTRLDNHIPSGTISLGDTEPYPVGTRLAVKPYPLGTTQKKDSKEKRKERGTPPQKPKVEKERDTTLDHPAVAIYRATFKRYPNLDYRQAIIMAVTDTQLWSDVCELWKANRWDYLKVDNLINRYQKGNSANGVGTHQSSGNRMVRGQSRPISAERDADYKRQIAELERSDD